LILKIFKILEPKGFLILKIFKKPGNQRLFNFQTNDHPTLVFYPVQAEKLANIRLGGVIKSQCACCTQMSFRQNPM
jgi:hypothetical protein